MPRLNLDSGIDYEADWSGECRVDPTDGNAYVLRSVLSSAGVGYAVVINDVLGGHVTQVSIENWLSWEKAQHDQEPWDS